MKYILTGLSLALVSTISVQAASSDGDGPWADEVVSYSQGLMKDGGTVPAIRSNPESTIGVAEETNAEGTFFSLGFDGNIVLKFNKGFSGGVLVVESTWSEPFYPIESAKVEISDNGSTWYYAGTVDRDQTVEFPQDLECAKYVRITNTGQPDLYPDDIADGYDVDGVKVVNVVECEKDSNNEESNETPESTSSSQPEKSNTGGSSSSNSSNDTDECKVATPGTPSLSATRTSSTTALLEWNEVKDTTHYVISYGIESGIYIYGVPNTGDTNSFVVGGLAPDKNYYFIVRGVNRCLPGEASNEVSINDRVLGASSDNSSDTVLGVNSLANTGSVVETIKLLFSANLAAISSTLVYKRQKSKK